jgi:hypothetical protein
VLVAVVLATLAPSGPGQAADPPEPRVTLTGTADVPFDRVTVLRAAEAYLPLDRMQVLASTTPSGDEGRSFSVEVPTGVPVYLRLSTSDPALVPDLFLGGLRGKALGGAWGWPGQAVSAAYPRVRPVAYASDVALPAVRWKRTGSIEVSTDRRAQYIRIHRLDGSLVGDFGVGPLIPGDYQVVATAWEGTGEARTRVRVRPGRQTEARLTFPDEAITGVVASRDGDPLADVQVKAVPVEGIGQASVRTDGHGGFRLAGLGPGRYVVSLTGRSEASRRFVRIPAMNVTVTAGRVTRLGTVRMFLGGTVSGFANLGDRYASDSYGDIWLQDRSGALPLAHLAHGRSFQLNGIQPGRYVLVLQRGRDGAFTTRTIRVRAGGTVAVGRLTPTRFAPPLTLEVPEDASVWGEIRSRKASPFDRTIEYHNVYVEAGRAVVRNVVPGLWRVRLGVEADQVRQETPATSLVRTSDQPVTFRPPLTTTAERREGSVRLNGVAIAGVAPTAGIDYPLLPGPWAPVRAKLVESVRTSDPTGRFSFWWSLPGAPQTLTVQQEGLLPDLGPFYFEPAVRQVDSVDDLARVDLVVAGGPG